MKTTWLTVSGSISILLGLMLYSVSAVAESKQNLETSSEEEVRTEILVPASGKILILKEMRQMLMATQGVVAGLSLHDINPAIREKLPQTFRGLGMSVHQDFDALADGIVQGETDHQILTRLSSLMSRCIACHEKYRLSAQS